MRYALGRVLWIIPTLLVVSLLSFWILAQGDRRTRGEDEEPWEARLSSLPLFYNRDPRDVGELARAAVERAGSRGELATASQGELVRLGGAALPHVLPQLATLPPTERGRVAVALAPLAERMGISSNAELQDPEAAVVFWTAFWEDHAIDFRPAVAQRVVARVAERSSPSRREDVLKLDTFALGAIIEAMGDPHTPEEVERVRRLSKLAAHVAGVDWRVSSGDSVDQAAHVARLWRRWWAAYASDFGSFDGPAHLAARVTETQFGRWVVDVTRGELGTTLEGEPVARAFARRAPLTLWLTLVALVGGWLVGVAAGLLSVPSARGGRGTVLDAVAVVALAVPAATVGVLLAPAPESLGLAVGAVLVLLPCAALVSRFQRASTRSALEREHVMTALAFGASRRRVLWRGLRESALPAIAQVGVELPTVLTLVFAVEHVVGLSGLATPTLLAVMHHDVAWLMALSLVTTLAVALMRTLGDVLLMATHPLLVRRLIPRRWMEE